MKRSAFGKTVVLLKRYLEEESLWGVTETVPASKAAPAPEPVRAPQPKAGPAVRANGSPAAEALEAFKKEVAGCKKCRLGESRLNVVFGVGSARARLMFVGEGPGFDEDHQGEPFVGKAGQLLNKIIESIGLSRPEVYIANIVKCHPMIDPSDPEKRGNDRPPTPEEAEACLPYLERQIDIIRPAVICALGNSAAQKLLKIETGISKLRGRFYEYKDIPLMPTYHPAALLRNPSLKKDVWEDMKMIRELLKKDAEGK